MALNRKHISLFVVLLILIPIPINVVPKWVFTIVDSDNTPIGGVKVNQNWRHSTFEFWSHSDQAVAGPDGKVILPERNIYIPVTGMVVMPIINFFRTGIHTSYGAGSWVMYRDSKCGFGLLEYKGHNGVLAAEMRVEKSENCSVN